MKLLQRFFFSLALVAGASVAASAAVMPTDVSNLVGTIEVTANSNLFSSPAGEQTFISVAPQTGVFADVVPGSIGTIKNLNSSIAPVGTPFLLENWITFSNGITLDLTYIPVDSSVPVCTASSTTLCRATAASPIQLQQTQNSVLAFYSVSGVANLKNNMEAAFTGILSAQLVGTDIASVLSAGTATTSYSASINVVPEPGSFAMLGAGLISAGLFVRNRRRAQANS